MQGLSHGSQYQGTIRRAWSATNRSIMTRRRRHRKLLRSRMSEKRKADVRKGPLRSQKKVARDTLERMVVSRHFARNDSSAVRR